MEYIQTTLAEVRPQRDAMLAWIYEERREYGRTRGLESYRLVAAFVDALECVVARDCKGARRAFARWELFAERLLDKQLFDDSHNTVAVSMSTGETRRGVDGCTFTLGEMVREHRAILVDAMDMCADA